MPDWLKAVSKHWPSMPTSAPALANQKPEDNVGLFVTLNELMLKAVLSSEMTSFLFLIFKYHFKSQMSEVLCVHVCVCVCTLVTKGSTEPVTLAEMWPGGPLSPFRGIEGQRIFLQKSGIICPLQQLAFARSMHEQRQVHLPVLCGVHVCGHTKTN